MSAAQTPGPNLPPQDLDAEEALLGAMMLAQLAVDAAFESVARDDFYREAHAVVFDAMQRLYRANREIDSITVSDELATMGVLDDIGGTAFVQGLTDAIPAVANAAVYARIVHDLAVVRRLISAGIEIAQSGYDRSGTADELVEAAEGKLFEISQERARDNLLPISNLLHEEFERIERLNESGAEITGTPTGLRSLDRLLSGFQPSNLLILAARPGMGKTSLALSFARHVGAEADLPVCVFSLEMSRLEVTQRLMCSEALVDSSRLRTGRMSGDDWARLTTGCDRLMRAPIFIDDTAGITVLEMRSKVRRLKSREPRLGLVVVDYLQLMSEGDSRIENRVQEISKISRSLKLMARDLEVPVVALSQLSRAVESRTDKRPLLSDLRESGSIEQDADVVMFIYRDEYYNREDDNPNKGTAELIVAKHRNGATGDIRLAFRQQYTLFSELATDA